MIEMDFPGDKDAAGQKRPERRPQVPAGEATCRSRRLRRVTVKRAQSRAEV